MGSCNAPPPAPAFRRQPGYPAGEHHRVVFLYPLTRLLHAAFRLLFVHDAGGAAFRALFCRSFIFHTFKGGDIQRIDGAQRLSRAPLAGIVLFLHPRPGAPSLGHGMLQRRARGLLLRSRCC
jgi:hypothetical protein